MRWWLRLCLALLVIAIWAAIVALIDSDRPTAPKPTTQTPLPALGPTDLALLEAQARSLCASNRGRSTGHIQLPDGVLVCDPRSPEQAARPRSEITTAWKVAR
jgi:hypothetical protein